MPRSLNLLVLKTWKKWLKNFESGFRDSEKIKCPCYVISTAGEICSQPKKISPFSVEVFARKNFNREVEMTNAYKGMIIFFRVPYVPYAHSTEENRHSDTPIVEGKLPTIVMEFLSDRKRKEYNKSEVSPYGKWYFYEKILKVPWS